MPLTILAGVVVLAQALIAARPPRLLPRIIFPGEGVSGAFWRLAPDIGIVTIKYVRRVGPDVEVDPGRLVVHLMEVGVDVENVMQGDLMPGPAHFYFFTNTLGTNVGYTTPLSWFQPSYRYAVFLREDAGVLRTMADLTEPNIRIRSGRHANFIATPEHPARRDPGTAIAALALTPSGDHEKGFATGIEDAYDRLMLIARPWELARFLRRLLTHADLEIRERACLALSIHYSYSDPCFEGLLESSDPEIKQQASIWAPRKRASEQGLPAALKEDPISLSISRRVEDLPGDLEFIQF